MTQQFVPTYLSKEQFLGILDDLRSRVEDGDSYEGSLSYEFPWNRELGDPVTDPKGEGFRVRASYRIGNSQGQGGMRLVVVGEMRLVGESMMGDE
jgi:hypothetical protein